MIPTTGNEKNPSNDHTTQKVLISGNEAIARGLMESGVGFVSMYPGTPVTEVGDFIYRWTKDSKLNYIIFDYAINEIVALEEGAGASWSGIRSAVIFKHLGMNIASDALHSIMYSGIGGDNGAGLVIICGGDPQSSSSTNAMDVRMFSLHSKLPILFPSTVEELHEFTKMAFILSEDLDLPVMIYTTPKLNFASGPVYVDKFIKPTIKPLENSKPIGIKPYFRREFNRYINAIHYAIKNLENLNKKIKRLEKFFPNDQITAGSLSKIILQINNDKFYNSMAQNYPNNLKKENKEENFLIITGGQPFLPIIECLSDLSLKDKIPILKINLVFPINQNLVLDFIKKFNPQRILIIEELEPLIENSVKNLLFDNKIAVEVIGKQIYPRSGELTYQVILDGLLNFIGKPKNHEIEIFTSYFENLRVNLPIREPTFCPGCSHRNVFYALRKTADSLKRKNNIDVVFGGDIGCYTMSMSQPYSTMDWIISMGAGIGISNGIGRVLKHYNNENQKIVALIGDSTFFHSGLQGLLNILKVDLNITIVILNNYYVAMTGHQPTLTSSNELNDENYGFQNKQLDLEKFLKGIGANKVKSLNGYDIPELLKVFKKTLEQPSSKSGTQIIVVNAECALMAKRKAKTIWDLPRGIRGPEYYLQISTNCTKCNECYAKLGCTAIKYVEDEEKNIQYIIDEDSCMKEHCGSCEDVCPNSCIQKLLINPNDETPVGTESNKLIQEDCD